MSNDDIFNATDPVEFQKAVNQSFTQLIANATSSALKLRKARFKLYLPKCSARFEQYQFWESPVAAQVPVSPVEAPPHAEDLGRTNRKKNRASIAIGISVLAVMVVVLLIGSLICHIRRRNKRHRAEEDSNSQEIRLILMREDRIGNDHPYDILQGQNQMESQELALYSLDLTLEATRHFSDENKLGEGGFGPVYKVTI
ncbi:hypothetical protein Ddye_019582 [Dipteronia dyeriana]|uniref:Uncharacterized protein n=1 Tax=Dipteronia dyeriana TaxID=168575 RepID=A0AAD9WVV6_9ROSI|nr:hypothetical protein Ddye_019582 [Dipteronia dyeriana]